jgi:MFS family permease
MLHIRNRIARLSTAQIVTAGAFVAGLHFYLPVYVFFLQGRGLTLFDVNLLQIAALVSQFIAEVPTGILGDRFGRRRSVVIGLVLMGVSEASMLVASHLWHFIALQVVLGFGFAFISGSQQALVIDSLPRDTPDHGAQVKRALGRLGAAQQIGFVISFALAGLLFPDTQLARYMIPIALTAGALWLAALIVSFAREPHTQAETHTHTSSLVLLKSSAALLRDDRAFRRIVLLSILANSLGWYWIALYQPFLARADVPAAWFGPALALGTLLGAGVNANIERIERRLPRRHALLMLTMLPGVLYGLMALPQGAASALFLFVAQYATMNAASPLINAYANGRIDSRYRATALSLMSLLTTLYLVGVGVPIGALAEVSLPALFAAMGALIIINAVLFRINPSEQN